MHLANRLVLCTLFLTGLHVMAKPKALMIAGGCCHDYANQKDIIPDILQKNGLDFDWTSVVESKSRDHKNSVYESPDWIDGYNLVVHNECYGGIKDDAFVEAIAKAHGDSGVPALIVHCSLHSYRNAKTNEWRKFVGVTSMRHEARYPLEVTPVTKDHAAIVGFPDTWQTPNGELYIIEKVWDHTIPLAQAYGKETKKNHVVIWANTYGKARIFGTSLGHHNETMLDPEYGKFLATGAKWAMGSDAGTKETKMTIPPSYLTYNNLPMGTAEKPLVMRTFVRNPGLDKELVLPNHSSGHPSPKYSPGSGRESSGSYRLLNGIPAAIAVNAGPALSYAWDTTECRLLYGWANGFLDMTNYWGEKESGRRRSYGYTPYLKGFLFYKAQGQHPISVNGKSVARFGAPRYVGYSLKNGHPVFDFKAGNHELSIAVKPGKAAQTIELTILEKSGAKLAFGSPKTPVEIVAHKPGTLTVLIRPNAGEQHDGYRTEALKIDNATVATGEKLFSNLGCIACHTTDGGNNHGPTLKGLFGANRSFVEGGSAKVDAAYLRESIENPHAKTVAGYPKGMMPPYELEAAAYDSLILFIKQLR